MIQVRSFYLDLQEWAVEDPSWVPWVAPSPVRRGDTDGLSKVRAKAVAEMHQRVRERLTAFTVPAVADESVRLTACGFVADRNHSTRSRTSAELALSHSTPTTRSHRHQRSNPKA